MERSNCAVGVAKEENLKKLQPAIHGNSNQKNQKAPPNTNTSYQRSFRPEQADAFSPRSSANESACAAEESLFDPSREPSSPFR
jgi:hypothetical protein